ncbi:MAG: DNA alkylation repair protein [Candidatus Saccharibacteria bacterium]|nr:DNA alkylation repair protein [Candidatus Saccharibacteria bacterium]
MNYQDFQLRLTALVDDDYRVFVEKGVPTDYPILGIRMPHLHALAKEILTSGSSADFIKREPRSLEELLLRGFVIAGLDYEQMKKEIFGFVAKVDNWCAADTFCSALKSARKNREDFLQVLNKLFTQSTEFSIRIGLVCLLSHYKSPDYLAVIFDFVTQVKDREEYYIRMAVSWLVAECFIRYPDETWGFLSAGLLPAWVQNKAISKIRDSFRVAPEVKTALLKLKK